MRIHSIQHVEFETPGAIRDWAARRGHHFTVGGMYKGDELPPLGEIDMLVVMGNLERFSRRLTASVRKAI